MPSNPLITFIMCVMDENNEFVPTHSIYKARDSLTAAKKAFRAHKVLKIIHILNTNNNNPSVNFSLNKYAKKNAKKR